MLSCDVTTSHDVTQAKNLSTRTTGSRLREVEQHFSVFYDSIGLLQTIGGALVMGDALTRQIMVGH